MIDDGFYKSIAPLGENVPTIYKRIESALMYILGQIAIYDIDQDRFISIKNSRLETDLNKVRHPKSPVPADRDLQKFSMHIKVINDTMIGRGVRFQMVVANSLIKLFFGSFGD